MRCFVFYATMPRLAPRNKIPLLETVPPMKKTNFQLVIGSILACLSLFANLIYAQKSLDQPGLCGTESFQQFLSRHPKQRLLARPLLNEKSKLGPQDALGILPCNIGNSTPEIPVVVHVMHIGESVGVGSNISVAQINDAIRGLNDRWSKAIGDGVAIPIRFSLAKRAPDGSPSSGIVRYNASAVPRYATEGVQSAQNGPGTDDQVLKDLSKWPPDQYYNIWVVRDIQGSVLGFAHYPFFNEAPYRYDGTVIESNAMIYNSITLAHEMGHAFNLAHTFEGDNSNNTCPIDTDCTVDGDGVCDTPPHREDDCGPNNPCSNVGIWDNSRVNYMSYCGSNVSTRFTAGQGDRVLYALRYSSRNTLPISLGNSPTGNAVEVGITAFLLKDYLLCDSSFSPQIQLVNYGTQNINTLTYTLTLDNISLGSFTVNPNLAAGATQAVALQQIKGLAVGTHELSIVITDVNGAGDGTYDYDNSICVKFEHRSTLADFCADFENTSDLPEGLFTLATAQIKPKALPITCDAQGGYALEINGTAHNDTSYTAIIGPIDFSKNGGPQLFFDLARQSGFYCNTFAEMKISASSDCGNTFEQVFYKNDAPRFTCGTTNYIPTIQSLSTTTTRQTDPDVAFSPNSCQQWRKEIVDLEAYAGQKVFIKFEFFFNFEGSAANTIFLDNICVNNCTSNAAANITVDPAEKTSLCRTGTLKLGTQLDNLKGTNILWEAASSADGVYNSIAAKSDTSISAVMNTIGKYYFRVVTIKGGCADTSKVAEVTVNGALRFDTHPVSVSFCNKTPLALSSEISPQYNQLSYQWQRSSTLGGTYTNIPNATQATYIPTAPGVNYYRVRAKSADAGCTEITSFEASTTVDDSVDVKQDPEGFSACIGGRDTLTVLAAGSKQKYFWQEANTPTGPFQQVGTQNTYIPDLNNLGTRYFRVIVNSEREFCKDTSKIAQVAIADQPSTSVALNVQNLCESTLFSFQVPTQGGIAPLAYQWQKSSATTGPWAAVADARDSLFYAFSPAGTTYYRMLIQSMGRGCNTAMTNPVAVNADAKTQISLEPRDTSLCVGFAANLSVNASNPSLHQWQVSDAANGPFSNLNENTANFRPLVSAVGDKYYRVMVLNGFCSDTSKVVKVSGVPSITFDRNPQDASACEGSSIPTLLTSAQGGGSGLNYQWQQSADLNGNWVAVNGAVDSTFSPSNTPGLRYYRLGAQSTSCPAAYSTPAKILIDAAVKISTQPDSIAQCIGANAAFTMNASGNPTYQWQSSASSNGSFSNISGAQQTSFTPPSNAPGSTYYRVVLSSSNQLCRDTSVVVQSTVAAALTFVTTPKDITTCADGQTPLRATATGGFTPLTYQWQNSVNNNGPWTNVNNAQDSIYQPNAAPGVSFYRMVVFSTGQGCTSENSSVARVEIVAPISIISEPQGFNGCVGNTQALQVNTSNPGLTQYQWQSSTNGQNDWNDLNNGQNAQFSAPTNQNYSSIWYRVLVKDGSVGCGADTSLAVLVDIRTDFKIQKTLETCNNNLYGNDARVNFATLVQMGDPNSRWTPLDTLQNTGAVSNLDFSNWAPGKTYRFVATTTNAVAPCINISDTLSVLVKACCPVVCSTPPSAAFCTAGSAPIQLQTYLCANSEASGSWSVTAGPGINTPQAINSATFDPRQQTPGLYTLTYQLPQAIRGCQTSSAQNFNIVAAIDAGTPLPGISACNQADTTFGLASLLNNESVGGSWSILSGSPGSAFNPTGSLRTKGLSVGVYRFQYRVQGAAGCASDSAQVELNLQASPKVALGSDVQLTCAIPFSTLSNPDSNNLSLQFSWRELSGNANIANPNAPSIRVNNAGTYVLSVSEISNNCSASDTIQVSTAATFITAINTEVIPARCNNEQNAAILVKNVSGGKAPFSYSLNGQSSNSGGQYRNLKAGSYTLLIKDANNCIREETYTIAEASALDLALSGPAQFTRCAEPIELKISTNLDSSELRQIQWQLPNDIVVEAPDGFTRIVSPKVSSAVKVSIVDQNGCRAESQLFITVDKKISVYLPNAFSPTGSKDNQVFKPMAPAEKVQKVNSFRIMDRWGNQVLEQSDLDISDERLGWDGRSKTGVYAQGVYVYVAEVTYCDGSREKLAGEVLLLK